MKTAIITGTSQRLGLHLCERLLERDWRVLAITRAASEALNALQSPQLKIYALEEYNTGSVESTCADILSEHDEIDLLINNASIYKPDSFLGDDSALTYQDLIFIHMQMPAMLMDAMQPALNKVKGNIISITDIYSDNPKPDYSLYCSTKAGLKNLTLSAAKKWAPTIRANCIQPGPIKFLPSHTQSDKDKVMSETLLAFEGGFDPVFKTVEFIVGNDYLTGQCINVDGGRSLVRG